jgi:hypothetical protein
MFETTPTVDVSTIAIQAQQLHSAARQLRDLLHGHFVRSTLPQPTYWIVRTLLTGAESMLLEVSAHLASLQRGAQ